MFFNLLLIAIIYFNANFCVSGKIIRGHDPSLGEPQHFLELFPIGNLPTYPNSTRRLRNIRELTDEKSPDVTPLYQGYGTHFSYIYVGTPPQRQSVIVDTGSHWTAFPCTGCKNCGKHTDSYWNPAKSSTMSEVKCGAKPCSIRQSYAEGSSWNAIELKDKLYVGGIDANTVTHATDYSVEFKFGCQTSETGLFRTQLADGIMGFSMHEDALPTQLHAQKVVNTRMFAMCFREGGGVLTLGGVHQGLHSPVEYKNSKGEVILSIPVSISYAKLLHPPGSFWHTVNLLEMKLQHRETGQYVSVSTDKRIMNSGKGIIVDSGTTDTFLPVALKTQFSKLFKEISGMAYTEKDIKLTHEQVAKMPNIIFTIEGLDGKPFDVVLPWTNYVDPVGKGMYALRVYVTERSGGILGANFMHLYNVIFDRDGNKIGFAPSSCEYQDLNNKK